MSKLLKPVLSAVPAVFTASAIGVLSLLPSPPNVIPDFILVDKIEHGFAYLVLGLLTFPAVSAVSGKKQTERIPWRTVLISTLLCSLYGGLIEFFQGFTGRSPDLYDLAADAVGAAAGSIAAAEILFLRRRMKSSGS